MTFACGLYDRMSALYTGEVKPEGIDLNFLAIDEPRQIFDRMGKNLEFDACEMSSTEVFSRLAAGRNERSYLIQSYARDMGGGNTVMMREIDVPIRVRGRHWGGFRTAYKL